MNENLARELLELHTLGVGGSYTQVDVRNLAELMTGLSVDPEQGFVFRAALAEPGAETVLGKSYGGGRAELWHVVDALDDIAVHPDTARHIARKLAVHFVADDPEHAFVHDLENAFTETDGDLVALYNVLLDHPASAVPIGGKAKQPFDYMASAFLALGVDGNEIKALPDRQVISALYQPLTAMGQPFLSAPGPDGWAEAAPDWITPQGLATRISWAMGLAERLHTRVGDPQVFLEDTLGEVAGPALKFAARSAQTRAEGVGLVLASAEFNRR